MSKVISLALFALLGAAGQAQAAPAFTVKTLDQAECTQALDLDSTQLQLSLKPEQGLISGVFDVVLQNLSDKPVTQVCFLLNQGLKIDSLQMQGMTQPLKTPPEGNEPLVYRMTPKEPLKPGYSQHLKLTYAGKITSPPKFGRVLPDDVFVTAQTAFYPRFDRASKRRCPLQLKLDMPVGYLAVPSGAMLEQTGPKAETQVESICGLQNDYGFDLAAARYTVLAAPPVRVYSRQNSSSDQQQLMTLADDLRKSIAALEKQFGAHNFVRFNLVETNREDLGGMGKTNTVFVSNKYFGDPAVVAPAQYAYFMQGFKDPAKVPAEFGFYRRNVLAHEAAHLFLNSFYDYDQPWMAEGLPEFASLKALSDMRLTEDVARKLGTYREIWNQVPQRPLPALNKAYLQDQLGYLVNYQGTPLLLHSLFQKRGQTFWKNWHNWLADRKGPLRYEDFKAWVGLTEPEQAMFEKAFDPKGL